MMNMPLEHSSNDAAINRRKKRGHKSTGIVLALIVWLILLGGGFYAAKTYLDQSLQKIQQTNAMNVQNLSERLEMLSGEMKELKNELESTGQTISSSGSIQEEVSAKVSNLEARMLELENSLKILKEAP